MFLPPNSGEVRLALSGKVLQELDIHQLLRENLQTPRRGRIGGDYH